MKNIIIIILLACGTISAQTASGLINIASPLNELRVAQVSPANAYFGSSLQSTLTGDNLSDNFLFEAQIVYQIPIDGGWNLPLISRTGIPLGGGVMDNVEFGIHPWRFISDRFVLYGGIDFALGLIPGQNASGTQQDIRVLMGLEYFVPTETTPLTFALSPVIELMNLGRGGVFILEASAVAPITNGLGLLFEYGYPFDSELSSNLNVGVIVMNLLGL